MAQDRKIYYMQCIGAGVPIVCIWHSVRVDYTISLFLISWQICYLKAQVQRLKGTVSTVCLPGTVACYNLLGLYPSSQVCRDSNGVPNRQGQQVYVLDKQAGK